MIIQGFRYFARSRSREIQVNPQNPAKFTKTRKIPRNSVEILSNSFLYSNFETSLTYWMSLLAVNPQIYVKTSSLKCANNVPKLPGVDYGAKNWAIAMMLKALSLVHFWSVYVLLLKEQMMTSVRETLKTLVWSVQNRSISSEICPEKNPPCLIFTDCFLTKFAQKIPVKLADFSVILSLKIPRNVTFFSTTYQKPWLYAVSNFVILNPILKTIYTDILIVSTEKWHSWMIPSLSLLIFVTPASSPMIPVSICMYKV